MSIGVVDIFDQVVSHAARTGLFETVNSHEPKSAPGSGYTCAIWVDRIDRAPGHSGLQATTGVLVFNVRLYQPMISEPQDAIDPDLLAAVDVLLQEYSGDFELGGDVRCVDLLGQTGYSLAAKAGYVRMDSGTLFRVMDITLPLIINDIWSQHG